MTPVRDVARAVASPGFGLIVSLLLFGVVLVAGMGTAVLLVLGPIQ